MRKANLPGKRVLSVLAAASMILAQAGSSAFPTFASETENETTQTTEEIATETEPQETVTVPQTDAAVETEAPTTAAPETAAPETEAPTTAAPATEAETEAPQTTEAPTTATQETTPEPTLAPVYQLEAEDGEFSLTLQYKDGHAFAEGRSLSVKRQNDLNAEDTELPEKMLDDIQAFLPYEISLYDQGDGTVIPVDLTADHSDYIAEIRVPQQWLTTEEERDLVLLTWNKDLAQYETTILQEGEEYQTAEQKMEIRNDAESGETVIEYTGELPQIFALLVVDKDWQVEETETAEAETTEAEITEAEATEAETEVSGEAEPEESSTEVESEEESTEEVTSEAETTEEETTEEETTEEETTEEETTKEATARHQARRRVNSITTGDEIDFSGAERVSALEEDVSDGSGNFEAAITVYDDTTLVIDDDNIYQFKTGESVNLQFGISNTNNEDNAVIRFYVLFDGDSLESLGKYSTPDKEYILENTDAGTTYSMYLTKTGITGLYYYEIDGMEVSQTVSFSNNFYYPSPSSAGGSMRMWLVAMSQTEAENTDPDTIHKPEGEYMEFHWTTDPNTFTLAESYNCEGVSAYMDGSEDDTTIYIKNVEYLITLSCGTDTGRKSGEDYVVSADYEQAMVFPDNVGWNETILNAIKNNTITWVKTDKTDKKDAYYTVYAGDQVICTLSGDENITSISFRWDEEEERVYLEWTVTNPATDATGSYASSELPLNALTLTFDDKAFRVENADLLSDTATSVGDLNSDVKVTLNYSHKGSVDLTATAGDAEPIHVLTGLAMEKTAKPDTKFYGGGYALYSGADVPYTIRAWNQGLANYTKLNGGIIEDNMQRWFYIKNQNIDTMFADTYGEGLTITIYPATLCTPVSQTTTDAHGNTITLNAQSTGVNIPYSVSSSDSSATTTTAKLELSYDAASQCIVLKKMDDGSTVSGTYTIGANGTYATTADAMNAIGYVVTVSAEYKLNWKVDKDLRGGEEMIFTIPANAKDTTMVLTYDEPGVYNNGSAVTNTSSNTASAKSADGTSLASATSNSFGIQPDLRLFAEAAVNGGSYSSSVNVSDGDVVDYKVSFNNRSSYENLPIVDELTGGQVLLVEKQLNAGAKLNGQSLSAAGVETVTIDGVEYYRLSKAGTYTGVKLGNGYQTNDNADVTSNFMVTAGEITVSESSSGLNTVIKTYFANQAAQTAVQYGVGQNARIYVTFKTQADSSVVSTVNEDNPSFSIGSTAWAGDHQTHRLYTTTTGGGSALSFEKYIREEEDTGAESLVKHSAIKEGDSVVYKIVIQNNGSSTMNLTGNRMYDALPSTAGVFAWSKDTVTQIEYELDNATCTTTGDDYWYIDQIDPESGAPMDQYYIHWTKDFTASINGGGSLTIVVNCVYPDNDGDTALWDTYVKANNGADLTNSFYLDSHASSVTHELADTGKIVLRKGVFDTFWSWSGTYVERGSRLTYENGTSTNYNSDEWRTNVMYYAVVYNGGTTRMYLDKIYDVLPEGFAFSGMYTIAGGHDAWDGQWQRYGLSVSGWRSNFADTEDHFYIGGSYRLATVVDPEREVSYMNVGVTATTTSQTLADGKTQQTVTFSFGEIGRKAWDNEYDADSLMKFDEEKQLYYLEPGQALRFGYLCLVGPEATTEDIADNTLAMPYLDYNEAGLVADDYEKVVVHEQAGMIPNDGGCDVISSDEAAAYGLTYSKDSVDTSRWLASSVSLTRGKTVPGIQKSVGGVTPVVTDATDKTIQGSTDGYGTKYTGMTTTDSVINWKLRIYSESGTEGGNSLINYTITDTMDAPYAFTGVATMKLYTAAGKEYKRTFTPFVLGSRTENDTEVAFNKVGQTAESSKFWTTITVNGDPVEFGAVSGGVWYKYGTVQLLRDANGKETLIIQFTSSDNTLQGNYTIPDGWYADLCLHTMYNKDGDASNSPFYNEVLLTTESSFDASLVSHGRVMDEAADGTATTLRSGASIMLGINFSTSAVNKIEEIVNSNNNATSDADTEDGTWIMLQNKESEFTYHLIVTTPNEKALKELVVINQLPEEDDHSAYVDANMRESEFTVSLTEDPNFTVEIYSDETGELLSTLSSDQYIVYLSEKTSYTSDDWNGGMDGWTKYSEDMDETERLELLAKARSVRVIITDKTLSLMPADSEIKISFNSKVDDENAEPGMIAWSSFGYKYTVIAGGTTEMSLRAEPLKVGVKIPATPIITKTLETTDGETYVTEADQTFEFLIYNGTFVNGVSSAATVAEKIQLLEAAGKKYTCATVTVPAGSSEATSDSLNNLSVYTYEGDTLKATDEEWVWDNNANYTITELPCTNGYAFGGFNAGKADTNTYTFKQSSSTAVKIAALNTHDPREVEAAFTLTKNLLGELSEVQFAFSVKEVDGTTLKEVRNAYTGKIYNGTADAEKGVASFKRTFQWNDLEMHYLLVSEVENKRLSEGVDYVLDTTEYLVGVQYSTTGTPTVKYWKVTADGLQELSLGTNGETPIVFNNTVQPGRLNIEKYGTDKDADGNKVVLSGVVFGIYDSKAKAESAVAGDGTAIEELTTDENGTAVSKYLDYGKYWVKELSTPTGYQADTTIYGGDNGYTVGKDSRYVTVTVDNVPLTGKLALTKYGTDQDASGNDVTLSGAVFGIFTAKSYAEAEDASIDTAYKTITTGTNGYGESEALAYGTYWVKELVAPTGYQLDDTVYGGDTGFTVGKTEGTDGIVTITVNKNVPKTGTLTLTKYGTDADADNNKPVLSGAVFGIYATEDLAKSGTADDTTALEKITTGTDGTATTSALAYGTYWVKELTAPTGYQLDATPRSYTVGKTEGTNGNVSATWEDTPLTGKLALTKYGTDVDANNNKPVLSGAVFGIFNTKAAAEAETASATTAYATITTGTDGHGESIDLPYGTYWVKELTAPTGYKLSTSVYGGDTGFTVGKTEGTNGVVTVTVDDNVPSDGVLTIGKKDAATGENLSGAVYTVYTDKDCTTVQTTITVTDGVGSATLPYGTYYIKETTAPANYRLDQTVYGPYAVGKTNTTVTVDAFEDEHKLALPTGIRMDTIPYLLIALSALVFLVVIAMRAGKKGRKV